MDAVRWVLGEQSARQLRGARMDDVIFAGSSLRRPMGMAEVTLTLDNSDGALPMPFSEIALTRRAYRSGESEFFLNKTAVRLRDITDLLMDTGLAAELAAVVSQGEIDAILSAKPEQRRELFDGVAGTSKYRARKHEAKRRLEQTAANALRLNDLLTELEKELPGIDQQVRRAKRYQKITQQLRDLEILSFLHKTQSRREERVTVAAALDADQPDSTAGPDRQAELQAQVNAARYEEYQANIALDERNAVHAKLASEFQQQASAHAAAEAKAAELARRCEALDAEVDAAARLETDAASALTAKSDDLQRNRELRDQALQLAESAASAEASTAQDWEKAYTALRSVEDRRMEAVSAAGVKASLAATADAECTRAQEAVARLDDEIGIVEAQIADVTQRAQLAAVELEQHTRASAQLKQEQEAAERELVSCQRAVEQARSDKEAAFGRVAAASGRLEASQELRSAEFAAPAALLKARDDGKLRGVIGTIVDLVTLDRRCERALQALAARRMSDVVVRTADDALAAVEFLKAEEKGPVSLIVLSLLARDRGAEKSPSAPTGLAAAAIVGEAASFVQCPAEIRPAVGEVWGDATIVDSVTSALGAAGRDSATRFATLDGVVVQSGTISAGTQAADGDQATIAVLRAHKLDCDGEAAAAAAALEDAERRVARSQARVADLAAASLKATLGHRVSQAAHDRLQQEVTAAHARRHALDARRPDALAAQSRAQERMVVPHEQAAELARAVAALEQERREALEVADKHARDLNDGQARHRSAAAKAAALVERVAQLSDDVETARAALVRAQGQRKTRIASVKEAQAERDEVAVETARLALQRASAQETLSAVATELQTARNRRDQAQLRARELEAALELANARGKEQSLELERLRIRLAEIDAELALLQEAFAQNPATSQECDDVAARYQGYQGEPDSDLRRLRDELIRLGNVNMSALEDRAAALERCEFLRVQLQDLEAARAAILASIADMDAEALRQFNATFEKVSTAFSETFERLFNGGNAQMWVTEAADPSSAGIEISAQPPGKKMQNLNLLSGGERSLTAVALIFATLKVRPSPFYIFDEIDAALDEANISRFGALLGQLAGTSQIIIITHNKATMTLVDRMYGIAAGEAGVSNVVSLSLERAGAYA